MIPERIASIREDIVYKFRVFGVELGSEEIDRHVQFSIDLLNVLYDSDESKMPPIKERKVESLRTSFDNTDLG